MQCAVMMRLLGFGMAIAVCSAAIADEEASSSSRDCAADSSVEVMLDGAVAQALTVVMADWRKQRNEVAVWIAEKDPHDPQIAFITDVTNYRFQIHPSCDAGVTTISVMYDILAEGRRRGIPKVARDSRDPAADFYCGARCGAADYEIGLSDSRIVSRNLMM